MLNSYYLRLFNWPIQFKRIKKVVYTKTYLKYATVQQTGLILKKVKPLRTLSRTSIINYYQQSVNLTNALLHLFQDRQKSDASLCWKFYFRSLFILICLIFWIDGPVVLCSLSLIFESLVETKYQNLFLDTCQIIDNFICSGKHTNHWK